MKITLEFNPETFRKAGKGAVGLVVIAAWFVLRLIAFPFVLVLGGLSLVWAKIQNVNQNFPPRR